MFSGFTRSGALPVAPWFQQGNLAKDEEKIKTPGGLGKEICRRDFSNCPGRQKQWSQEQQKRL